MRPHRSVADHVDVLLLVSHGGEALVRTLDAIAASGRPVDRLLALDACGEPGAFDIVDGHAGLRRAGVRVEHLARRPGADLVVAVRQALPLLSPSPDRPGAGGADGAGPGEEEPAASGQDRVEPAGTGRDVLRWCWILPDDVAPEPEALAALLAAGRASSNVAVVGPKRLLSADPERFLDFGAVITATGTSAAGPELGELDQGQYDLRRDVVGAELPGALVQTRALADLGGLDRAARGAEGLDLAWRALLSGRRVVLAPDARVQCDADTERAAAAGSSRARHLVAARRRSRRNVALSRAAWWRAPWIGLRLLLGGIGSAIGLLALGQAGAAARELADSTVLLELPRRLGARWRFRGRRRVKDAHLASLFVAPGEAYRRSAESTRDRRPWTDPAAREAAAREPDRVAAGVDTGGPGLPALLALGTLAVALLAFRPLLGSGAFSGRTVGLAGGELLPTSADGAGLWHLWTDAWHGPGLGSDVPAPPATPALAAAGAVVGALPGVGDASPVGTAISWLFLLSLPASAISAYLAGRALTRGRAARVIGAILWAGAPVLPAALAQGRLGPVLAHVALPAAVAMTALAVRPRGYLWAAFAAALLLALVGAFVPALLVAATVAALAAAVWTRGKGRLNALVAAALPWALLGPALLDMVRHPLLLLAGPGALTSGPGAPAGHVALLHPSGPSAVPLGAGALLVLLAGLALLPALRDRGARVGLAVLAASAVAAAVLAPRVLLGRAPVTADVPGAALHLWQGVPLQLATVALWALALLGTRALRVRRGLWWPALGIVATVAVLPLAALALRDVTGPLDAVRERPSAAVREAQTAGSGARALELTGQGAEVRYSLLGAEPAPWSTDSPLLSPPPRPTADAAVSALVSGSGAASGEAHAALARLGVAFVRAPEGAVARLGPTLDATSGLSRLGSADGWVTWRVQAVEGPAGPVPASRVHIVDGSGSVLRDVPVTGPHATLDTDVATGGSRRLVVAEAPGWEQSVRVTLDGKDLPVHLVEGVPTADLPVGGSRLQVVPEQPRRDWVAAHVVLVVLVALLALPFPRSRRAR